MVNPELSILAGPCSIRNKNQGIQAARLLGPHVRSVRENPVKPRTGDSWTGMGRDALPLLKDIKAETGVRLAMEATTARDTEWMLEVADDLWLGSKQNPNNTLEIAEVLRGVNTLGMFLIKNPPAPDEESWLGAIEVMRSRLPETVQLAAIFRGFKERTKPNGWRNNPDFDMARRVKVNTGLPMWIDWSHLIGDRDLIIRHIMSHKLDRSLWDGVMLEVDPDPSQARTDGKQQLSLDEGLSLIRHLKQQTLDLHGGVLLA